MSQFTSSEIFTDCIGTPKGFRVQTEHVIKQMLRDKNSELYKAIRSQQESIEKEQILVRTGRGTMSVETAEEYIDILERYISAILRTVNEPHTLSYQQFQQIRDYELKLNSFVINKKGLNHEKIMG